jgi:amino acid permease
MCICQNDLNGYVDHQTPKLNCQWALVHFACIIIFICFYSNIRLDSLASCLFSSYVALLEYDV